MSSACKSCMSRCSFIFFSETYMPHPRTPHLIHEYEGWVALAVVVLSLTGAGLLVRRALRR